MSLIFLIGMPGAGKTYWGKRWAGDRWFTDLDEAIEQAEHLRVAEIFFTHGEAYFREKEQYWLCELINNLPADAVIATGGGTPFFFDNMDKMKAAGCVVYLEATIEQLVERLVNDPAPRPLLNPMNLEGRLAEMLKERENIYRRASVILPVTNLSDAIFNQILLECTDRHS